MWVDVTSQLAAASLVQPNAADRFTVVELMNCLVCTPAAVILSLHVPAFVMNPAKLARRCFLCNAAVLCCSGARFSVSSAGTYHFGACSTQEHYPLAILAILAILLQYSHKARPAQHLPSAPAAKLYQSISLQSPPSSEDFNSPSIMACHTCRAGLGKPSRRSLQCLSNHRLLCQICSGQVHRRQVWCGRSGDSCPGGHHPAVPHLPLQCHAHECSGCHCHCWGAASAGLWQRCLPLLGTSTLQHMLLLGKRQRGSNHEMFYPKNMQTLSEPVRKFVCVHFGSDSVSMDVRSVTSVA